MLIFGFGYKARSGKDTAVKNIVDAFKDRVDVRRYAFADELKREFVEAAKEAGGTWELFNQMKVTHKLPDWVQYDFAAPKDDPICGEYGKHRTLLQWWGTEYRRKQDPMYWVRKLGLTLEKEAPAFALISDMRFPNEGAFIKLFGGYTVKVTRTGLVQESDHPSEHLLDGFEFDFELFNDGKDAEGFRKVCTTFFGWVLDNLKTVTTPREKIN